MQFRFYILSHHFVTTNTVFTKKEKKKKKKQHISNKIVNIKRGLMELSGPFPHFLHSKQ